MREWGCCCASLPTNLLVCQLVSNEVLYAMVSGKRFVLIIHYDQDLDQLMELNTTFLSSMTLLAICFNSWPCSPGHTNAELWRIRCNICDSIKPQWQTATRNVGLRDIIRWWELDCKSLTKTILPGTLRFTVICEFSDFETTRKFTAPLTALPEWKEVDIRLGGKRRVELWCSQKRQQKVWLCQLDVMMWFPQGWIDQPLLCTNQE